VTDPSPVTRPVHGLDALDQAVEVSGVEVDRCHRAPRVCQQGMVERSGKHFGAPSMQCTHVDVFDLTVGDIAAGPTPEACGLANQKERRRAVTGAEVAGWVHECLDQEHRI